MKKIIHSLTAFVGILCMSTLSFGQAAQQGNFIIDAYYGAPNWGKLALERTVSEKITLSDINGVGPTGLRFEYMVGERIGVGADVIYNANTADVRYDSLNADESIYKSYYGDASMKRLRVHARINYHFKITNPKLDAYFGLGAGSNSRFWRVSSQDPDFDVNEVKLTGSLLPVSARICTGIRYYFTPNFGLSGEIGLGGPLLSGGFTLKF